MSQDKEQREDETQEGAKGQEPAAKPSDGITEEPKAAKKKPYVFKIAKADPKNAFDFEDVADK